MVLIGERARVLLLAAMEQMECSGDVLRDLDAAVGDGDLGLTVTKGAAAVRHVLEALENPEPSELLAAAGRAFSQANPSTMASLTGAACSGAAKALSRADAFDRRTVTQLVEAAVATVARRGKAEVGDKTVLDPMVASLEALKSAGEEAEEALSGMVDAARAAVEATSGRVSRRGRPSWVGERGVGHPDPGAVAYLMFLEAFQAALRGANPAQYGNGETQGG